MLHLRVAALAAGVTMTMAHPTHVRYNLCEDTRPFPSADAASHGRRVTVTYHDADIRDVVASFATYSARQIVISKGVDGTVTFEAHDQPWDLALQSILASRRLTACETKDGTILVGGCVTNPFADPKIGSKLPNVTLEYDNADLRQVAFALSKYSRRTIIVAPGVSEFVTASIHDQPWNVAMQSILSSLNLTASEDASGVITIDVCH